MAESGNMTGCGLSATVQTSCSSKRPLKSGKADSSRSCVSSGCSSIDACPKKKIVSPVCGRSGGAGFSGGASSSPSASGGGGGSSYGSSMCEWMPAPPCKKEKWTVSGKTELLVMCSSSQWSACGRSIEPSSRALGCGRPTSCGPNSKVEREMMKAFLVASGSRALSLRPKTLR